MLLRSFITLHASRKCAKVVFGTIKVENCHRWTAPHNLLKAAKGAA
jgi:hypothetical protein